MCTLCFNLHPAINFASIMFYLLHNKPINVFYFSGCFFCNTEKYCWCFHNFLGGECGFFHLLCSPSGFFFMIYNFSLGALLQWEWWPCGLHCQSDPVKFCWRYRSFNFLGLCLCSFLPGDSLTTRWYKYRLHPCSGQWLVASNYQGKPSIHPPRPTPPRALSWQKTILPSSRLMDRTF